LTGHGPGVTRNGLEGIPLARISSNERAGGAPEPPSAAANPTTNTPTPTTNATAAARIGADARPLCGMNQDKRSHRSSRSVAGEAIKRAVEREPGVVSAHAAPPRGFAAGAPTCLAAQDRLGIAAESAW
jgi:hypothetical protein